GRVLDAVRDAGVEQNCVALAKLDRLLVGNGDRDRAARHDEALPRAMRLEIERFAVVRGDADLVELGRLCTRRIEQRSFQVLAVAARDDLAVALGQYDNGGRRLGFDQARHGHAERIGDLPQEADGRNAFAGLDLTQHGAAYARELGELFKRMSL